MGITTNTTFDFSSKCVVLALMAGCWDFQPRFCSTHDDCCLSSISVSGSTHHDCKCSLRKAFPFMAQCNTNLLDEAMYLMQSLWSRHFTKLCQQVRPWECVSEIQCNKDTHGVMWAMVGGFCCEACLQHWCTVWKERLVYTVWLHLRREGNNFVTCKSQAMCLTS